MTSISPSGGVLTSNGWNTSSLSARSVITLQQLTSFGMRNIAIPGVIACELMDLYFKLVIDGRVIYVSEIARNTLNPVWMPFQPDELLIRDGDETRIENLAHLFWGTVFDIIVVRVRDYKLARRKSSALSGKIMAEEDESNLSQRGGSILLFHEDDTVGDGDDIPPTTYEEEILKATFSVRELDPLPVGLTELSNLPLNTCLLEFNGRTYVKREVIELLVESGVISSKHSRRKGSAIQLKDYSLHEGVDNLERVRMLKQHIDEVTKSNEQLQQEITHRLTDSEDTVGKDQERALVQTRIQELRRQIIEKRDALERVKSVVHDERRTFETDIHIPKALLSTMQMSMRFKDEKQGILERRCEVLRAAHKIRSRQAMLVKELSTVYPIEYVGAGEYAIRGIRVSTAELQSFGRGDEELLCTGLGYIAHLVFMLSKYLQVNLRYRVMPYSSRSFIKDEINDPLGEYPLYRKGVEKERFERAIFFLKKDVEQLLFARGLDPTQGAPILGRLKALTDAESSWLAADRDVTVVQGPIAG
ncbi:hypothetical protein Poli38472_005510 [Pythium oligandrum]|uniref:UV radiation resistance-associated gene protein n=1 Tax=Pythium oligandrum TaxID=41045 RepID=A0A8K1CIQ2_PYTOL|nr:hypothetical protein Poli38472_005510 [Pythium oligandrum]|eukprot:TMW62892.1 hypothetical protein Poli38472_005510 [Pythium oligandrum]